MSVTGRIESPFPDPFRPYEWDTLADLSKDEAMTPSKDARDNLGSEDRVIDCIDLLAGVRVHRERGHALWRHGELAGVFGLLS